jgi:hypothetical protein
MALNGISTNATTWNGPICSTCGARYLDSHRCSREDIARRITELARLMETVDTPGPVNRMAGCPCRKENGGSGICGCIMGGTQIICHA